MTKKLEEVLNLPDAKEIIENESTIQIDEKEETVRDIAELDKITAALPQVKGLGEKADKELEDIAQRALTAYDDLMDLGMNVESRYAGRIMEVAGNMLKTSLDAKTAKLDKKLKMIELQLKKQKLDSDTFSEGSFTEGAGYVVSDRNSLLERLKGLNNDAES